ncbi:hypothetical protein IB238_09635 [Rhizobium sp. ARZ01]|uniref:hypothetical protein n=1 Tax=Rhizobium sp. ARZ01 TaxID=2769313 RepID=UPI001782CA06|nr:hypothetical protein [Rhizobium sp. ARZ01]MBD9372877.1 hypothetical protein [Rhizobium sp. ARZ01]
MVTNRLTVRSGIAFTLALAFLAVLFSLAFAGWIGHGSAILLSMAETGLSWCF